MSASVRKKPVEVVKVQEKVAKSSTLKEQLFESNQDETGFRLTKDDIDAFLEDREERGLLSGTLERYRRALSRLYQVLPDGKIIKAGTLAQWRQELLDEGISPASINVIFSVCDSFLDFVGHREFQVGHRLLPIEKTRPELTRNEYLRLLQTAKSLGKERTYMLVKVLGSTDMRIQELSKLTVESLQEGRIITGSNGQKQTVWIPNVLRKELQSYADRNGIQSGMIFTNRNGTALNRSSIAVEIQRLGEEAHIPEGKANAKALHKLWQEVRNGIASNMELLIDQAMNRKLEQEELSVGWEA